MQKIPRREDLVLFIFAEGTRIFARRLGKRVVKKLLFGSVALVALVAANAASAADVGLPVKGRTIEPAWNWSGFYAGSMPVNGRLEALATTWIVRAGVDYKFGG